MICLLHHSQNRMNQFPYNWEDSKSNSVNITSDEFTVQAYMSDETPLTVYLKEAFRDDPNKPYEFNVKFNSYEYIGMVRIIRESIGVMKSYAFHLTIIRDSGGRNVVGTPRDNVVRMEHGCYTTLKANENVNAAILKLADERIKDWIMGK